MQGVVFDFDGVIAQSMEQHAQAYADILTPLDIPCTPQAVYAREGARSESIIAQLAQAAGKELDEATIRRLADAKQARFAALGPIRLYPGAAELVQEVAERVPVGLVTGTRLANLQRIIPDLMDHFVAILAQENYSRDKPHPEPYQKAAAAMGIEPRHLIAVENATRGVQSAQAAGYGEVLAIRTTLPAEALPTASVADHAALRVALLDKL